VTQSKFGDGGCQCGKIRYRLTGEPLTLYVCHCSDCQTFSGSAFRTGVLVAGDDFRLLEGTPAIYEKTAAYGHFGRDEPEFTWERTDRAEALRAAAGL